MPDTTSTPPAETLHYAVDLTAADLDALRGFLHERVDALLVTHPVGSPEYRTASALQRLVAILSGGAQFSIDRLTDPDLTTADRIDTLYALKQSWYGLVAAAASWSEDPGFDRARWREVDTDPAYAAGRRERIAAQRAQDTETGARA